MVRRCNEDLGGEVIDPDSVERFVLASGRDHARVMMSEGWGKSTCAGRLSH